MYDTGRPRMERIMRILSERLNASQPISLHPNLSDSSRTLIPSERSAISVRSVVKSSRGRRFRIHQQRSPLPFPKGEDEGERLFCSRFVIENQTLLPSP